MCPISRQEVCSKKAGHRFVPGLDHGPLRVPPTQPGLHQSDKKGMRGPWEPSSGFTRDPATGLTASRRWMTIKTAGSMNCHNLWYISLLNNQATLSANCYLCFSWGQTDKVWKEATDVVRWNLPSLLADLSAGQEGPNCSWAPQFCQKLVLSPSPVSDEVKRVTSFLLDILDCYCIFPKLTSCTFKVEYERLHSQSPLLLSSGLGGMYVVVDNKSLK